jgi:hypothetical protein
MRQTTKNRMLMKKNMSAQSHVGEDIRVWLLGILILNKNIEISIRMPARFMTSFTEA